MELKESLIKNRSILLNKEAKDWEEAIKLATSPLEKSGAITSNYYKEIIKNTKEYGPYYIIAKEVAMPHARPEAGVIRDSFSLLTLKKPVDFGEEKISILIVLAATSAEKHNEWGLVQVADLFEDESIIEKIKDAKDESEILNLIS